MRWRHVEVGIGRIVAKCRSFYLDRHNAIRPSAVLRALKMLPPNPLDRLHLAGICDHGVANVERGDFAFAMRSTNESTAKETIAAMSMTMSTPMPVATTVVCMS